jgi:hypothetical protein
LPSTLFGTRNFNKWGKHGVVALKEKGKEKDATEINTEMKTFMVTKKNYIRKKIQDCDRSGSREGGYLCPGLLLLRVLPG